LFKLFPDSALDSIAFNDFKDNPNDEGGGEDDPGVSARPKNDRIYLVDSPGYKRYAYLGSRLVRRDNFLTFVRVRFDGGAFTHGTPGDNDHPQVQGSRASDYEPWHIRIDLKDATTKWIRNPDVPASENEVELNFTTLANVVN
jgi:hypothetical protein